MKNTDCCTDTLYTDEQLEPGRNCEWFYCDENLAYSLEQEERSKGGLDEEIESKSKNRIKSYKLDEKNPECVPFLDNLIDQYDEESVLLQIPQEDTKVEEVVKKFKDQNKW